jgi:hypothetical protein
MSTTPKHYTFLGTCTVVGLFCLAAVSANAKVATPDWKSLFQSASIISVVKVDSVKRMDGVRIAIATVLEPVAGLRIGQKIAYVAQPAWFWTCDVSDAKVGETVLLLLVPIVRQRQWRDTKHVESTVKQETGDAIPLCAIAWSGWGRLQAHHRGGDWWINAPAFRDMPTEFRRQQLGHAIPLTAVRAFKARLEVQRRVESATSRSAHR